MRAKNFIFNIDPKNDQQKEALELIEKNDITFLLGPAGCGKSYLSIAFAVKEILTRKKKKIVLTRPVIEAGENLGFLPGTFEAKLAPYLVNLNCCIEKCAGTEILIEKVGKSLEVAPLAFLRGRTFENSICILDEAQNASFMQLKLFLTRIGEGTKMIINGDPSQSDLRGEVALLKVVEKLKEIEGIGTLHMDDCSIVRHKLIAEIIKRLDTTH